MKQRDRYGRYKKNERRHQIIGWSILGGILLELFLDAQTRPSV